MKLEASQRRVPEKEGTMVISPDGTEFTIVTSILLTQGTTRTHGGTGTGGQRR